MERHIRAISAESALGAPNRLRLTTSATRGPLGSRKASARSSSLWASGWYATPFSKKRWSQKPIAASGT